MQNQSQATGKGAPMSRTPELTDICERELSLYWSKLVGVVETLLKAQKIIKKIPVPWEDALQDERTELQLQKELSTRGEPGHIFFWILNKGIGRQLKKYFRFQVLVVLVS